MYGVISVSYLQTYTNIGSFELILHGNVDAANTINNLIEYSKNDKQNYAKSIKVDCMSVSSKTSITVTAELRVNVTELREATRNMNVGLTVNIIESNPPRANNKVKILAIYMY